MVWTPPDKFHNLLIRALDNGAERRTAQSTYWNIAGRCTAPVLRTIETGNCKGESQFSPDKEHRLWLDVHVACRKCENCLKARSRLWAARARSECKCAKRTWFATYTVAPEHRTRFLILAGKKIKEPIFICDTPEKFRAVYDELGKEFTKYLKRIRKASGVRLRYILIGEAHKDGFPHLHALIHETDEPIRKRMLEGHWPFGFTKIKLTDGNSSYYVTKYLAKSLMARVRASLNYGRQSIAFEDAIAYAERRETTTPRQIWPDWQGLTKEKENGE